MKKHSKQNFAIKRARGRTYRGWVVMGVLFIGMVASFGIYRLYQQSPDSIAMFNEKFLVPVKGWIASHHHAKEESVAKAKQQVQASRGEEIPPIHFEFYKTLPNLQMSATETSVSVKKEMKLINKRAATAHAPKKVEIADADELARELSAAVTKSQKNNREYLE